MAEKVVRVRTCDFARCGTPEVGVQRIEIAISKTVSEVDVCTNHRKSATFEEVVGRAHKKSRRGMRVVDPADIPRT